jgi:hypothetical protein
MGSTVGAAVTGLSVAVVATPPAALDGIAVPEPFRRPWTWPQRLQAAVLANALEDVHRTGTARALRLAEDARGWVASDDDAGPFAFVAVCASLGLDPGAVRRAVAARAPKPRPLSLAAQRRAAWHAAGDDGRPDVLPPMAGAPRGLLVEVEDRTPV